MFYHINRHGNIYINYINMYLYLNDFNVKIEEFSRINKIAIINQIKHEMYLHFVITSLYILIVSGGVRHSHAKLKSNTYAQGIHRNQDKRVIQNLTGKIRGGFYCEGVTGNIIYLG